MRSPFAALTANFPTWTDYKYSQHTKSNTAYTEALYDSLNELEAHFQSYILGCVETLVQSNHLQNFRPQTAGITLMIANFLRVAPQRINLGSNYASIVGACIYLSITCRPDISHAVGRISRAMHNPTPENANQVIQLLGYSGLRRGLGVRVRVRVKFGSCVIRKSNQEITSDVYFHCRIGSPT